MRPLYWGFDRRTAQPVSEPVRHRLWPPTSERDAALVGRRLYHQGGVLVEVRDECSISLTAAIAVTTRERVSGELDRQLVFGFIGDVTGSA